jgi:ssDNA-binding Zn-finger/Zn-ribbon topoisomerase 1
MRHYKKISECPPELEKIIELVNLMPPGVDGLLSNIQDSAEARVEAKKILDEKLIDYLFGYTPTLASMYRPFNLIKAKNLLSTLSEMSRRFASEFQNNLSDTDRLYLTYMRAADDARFFQCHLVFDSSNGVIKPVKNELFEIFEKYKIPFYRIRSCPICHDFYWAKKTNSQSCGRKKCIDDLQNQKKKLQKTSNQKNNRDVKAVASKSKDLID